MQREYVMHLGQDPEARLKVLPPHQARTVSWRDVTTSPGSTLRKDSTSGGRVWIPRVTRSEPNPHSGDKPIAFVTSLGSGLPVLQADPEEQAKPAASSKVSSRFPSTSLNTKEA